jgi:hypothetical protein
MSSIRKNSTPGKFKTIIISLVKNTLIDEKLTDDK